jgi:hypothetical protein
MLKRIDFDPDLHAEVVREFDCGRADYALEVSAWITAPDTRQESAAYAVRRLGCKVWLYFEDDNALVGYTSLSKDRWKLDGERESPVVYLPYLGVGTVFQGKKEPSSGRSYFGLMFEDLLHEAGKHKNLHLFWVCLHVHKNNKLAREIYHEKYGFRECGEEDDYIRMFADMGEPST